MHFKKRIRERYPYLLVIILFWMLAIVINDPFDESKGNTNVEQRGGFLENVDLGEVLQGDVIQQKFKATSDGMQSIQFKVGTYGERVNNCKYEVTVQSENTMVFEETLNANELSDGSYYKCEFDRQPDSAGKEYTISIEGVNGEIGNSITFFTTKEANKGENKLLLNNQEADQTLIYKVDYFKSFQTLKIGLWIFVLVLSIIFTLFFDKADEKSFLLISFVLGIFLVFLTPFVHKIDESTHFFRSYCISQGDFYDSIENGSIGAYVSDNYPEIVETRLDIKTFLNHPSNWQQEFSDQKEFYVNAYMASVVPINHSIAAIGILLGKILSLNALAVILLGRMVNYLFYVVAGYFAIRNMKYYKSLFFIVATLPLSIWLGASYSADPVLLGASLLFASICLKYRFDESLSLVSKKDIFLLILCGISISSVKYLIYTPILLTFFLIPSKKFRKKVHKPLIVIAVFIVAAMALWQLSMLKLFPFTEDRNGFVNVKEQIKFVLTNIPYSISNFTDYFFSHIFEHLEGFFNNFAVEGKEVGIGEVSRAAGVFAVMGAFLEQKKYPFKNKKENVTMGILFAFIFFASYGLSMLALYVGYTPVGMRTVQGLQTRYLIPILVFLMMVVSMLPIENKIKNHERNVSFFMGVGIVNILLGALLTIFK